MNNGKIRTLCVILAVLVGLLAASTVMFAIGRAERAADCELIAEDYEKLAVEHQKLSADYEALSAKYNDSVSADYDKLSAEYESLNAQYESLSAEYESLKAEHAAALEDLTSEYKLYKNVISQDEVEQTLFGQPISTERNGEYRIGVKTAIDGDYHAELSIYQAQDGKYVKVFSCPAVVGKNGPGKQSEGDTKTPLGTWTIGEAYGINDDPGSLVPYTKITDDMYWCATGSNGKNYNTLLYRSEHPDWDYSEDEHLIDYPIRYAYLLDLGYNAPGAPYAGNAIFLHCWKEPDYPTGGCVGISEEDMITVLQTVTPGTAVTIY